MPIEKHILVIRLSAMGDVAMVVPVLRALTQQYPRLKVTVLTRAFFYPFFRDLERVEVLFADVKGVHKGVFGLYKLAEVLNKEEFSAVADLHNVLRSKILKRFLRYKHFIALDKGRKEKKFLISGKVFKQLKTTHQRYADVFGKLGYKVDLMNPTFPKRCKLSEGLKNHLGKDFKKWIGIAMFSAHDGKMYPLNLMEIVLKKLSKDYKIILFGAGDFESEKIEQFQNKFDNIVSMANKVSLAEEMDVISNLDLMVAMDSGNAHIAAMLGVKVITIWGVTHPYAGFTPFNQPAEYALTANREKYPLIPTSVYGNKFPESYKNASGSVSPQSIVDKINAII